MQRFHDFHSLFLILRFIVSDNNIVTLRKKFKNQSNFYHEAKAINNIIIKKIHTITRRQDPQPSSNRSKIEPIPLKIQPKMPPPVKTASINTIIPIIASISIYLMKTIIIDDKNNTPNQISRFQQSGWG